jgi:hypothetical protein
MSKKKNVEDLVDFFMSKGNSLEEIVSWIEKEMEVLRFDILVDELERWDNVDAEVAAMTEYPLAESMLEHIVSKGNKN